MQRSSSLKPARKLFCKFTLEVSSLLQEPKGLWMLCGTSCTYLLPLQSRNCAGFVQFQDVRQQTDTDPTGGSTDQLSSVSLSLAALFFFPKAMPLHQKLPVSILLRRNKVEIFHLLIHAQIFPKSSNLNILLFKEGFPSKLLIYFFFFPS